MPKKLTIQDINLRLSENFPYLTVKESLGGCRYVFMDSEFGEFTADLQAVTSGRCSHFKRRKTLKNLPLEEIDLRLKKKQPHLSVKKFVSVSSPCSVFVDEEYGEFSGRFSFVISGKKLHKERSKKIRSRVASLASTKDAREKTVLEKYGVKNVSNSEIVKKKREETFNVRFGGHPMQSSVIKEKVKNTFSKKYGAHPFSTEKVREEIKKTMIERYGVDNPGKSKIIVAKTIATKISTGVIKNIDNKTIASYIHEENMDVSRTHLNLIINKFGIQAAKSYTKGKTSVELFMSVLLDSIGASYVMQKSFKYNGSLIRSDFYLEKYNLAIECDGLYFHSDLFKDKRYHINKKNIYNKNNVTSLFFREDELVNSPDVVLSIIKNKLHMSNSIGARKTSIHEIDNSRSSSFFDLNHLMKRGCGRTFALLDKDENIACAIRIINHKTYIEVSRFASAINTSVSGGLSKLLKHINKIYSKDIVSFVDIRYGDGNSLYKLGFEKVSLYPSFYWTNFSDTFHRLKFKGSTGYDVGLRKIWDCGQAKFILKGNIYVCN